MTDSRAAVGLDRLPWLADEPKRPAGPKGRELAGWAFAVVLLIAGSSYWLGTRSGGYEGSPRMAVPAPARPTTTLRLPEPTPVTNAPEVPLSTAPEVRSAPAPTVDFPQPEVARTVRRVKPAISGKRRKLSRMELNESDLAKTVTRQEGTTGDGKRTDAVRAKPVQPPRAATLARAQQLRLWPSRQAKGASGRLVQIGAFGSRQQAKLGWRRMTRSYPAVGRLPAVVVEARNSRGRRFYRFQIGTTSQAHSEGLCQRMERIRFSCAVVGLAWKAKVER